MNLKESTKNTLEYKKLSKEEMISRGILGRLVGICADFQAPTRNGRLYSEELWEKVFDNPLVVEQIKNGVCYGELGHPTDRTETDMEKIAVCLAEVPTKGPDGKLRAIFDILDTPNGRILKTLCDYGSTIGISSRGSGDTFTDSTGQETVDPDTYEFTSFDAVLVPAVESARLQYVTESLNTKKYNKTLRNKLQETLDSASEDDRKVMSESLTELGITLNESPIKEPTSVKNINDGIDVKTVIDSLEGNAINIILYDSSNGINYASDYIKSIATENKKLCGKLLHSIQVFKTLGAATREPYTKNITDDGIYELRAKEGSNISRVLFYFVIGNNAILTNGFTKKTQETPQSEIDLARSLRKDYYNNGGK